MFAPGLGATFPGLDPQAFPRAPALSRWLRLARRSPVESSTGEQSVLSLFGLDGQGAGLPAAAFSYLADFETACPDYCLRADPVHLRADTNGLILFDAGACGINAAESRALSEAAAACFADAGWQLHAPHAQRWYLTGPQAEAVQTTALPLARGRGVNPLLPRGTKAALWSGRVNEVQMLLHAHPVNQARAARGQPVINSVWLWGGGKVPHEMPAAAFTRVFSDDAVIRGMALAQYVAAESVSDVNGVLQNLRDGDRLLLVLEGCDAPAAYGDFHAWVSALQHIDADWLEPLLQALTGARISRLELLPMNGYRYRLRPASRLQFWRRAVHWRQQLAGGET